MEIARRRNLCCLTTTLNGSNYDWWYASMRAYLKALGPLVNGYREPKMTVDGVSQQVSFLRH